MAQVALKQTPLEQVDLGLVWLVATLKPLPAYRALAAEGLLRQGYQVLVPMCREFGTRGEAVQRPMFDRYAFIGVGHDQTRSPICHTPGIQYLNTDVRMNALVLRREVMAAIVGRLLADGGVADLCPKPGPRYAQGERVRVTAGPMAGMEGLFDQDQGNRCRVLFDMMGAAVKVTVAVKQIERAA